MKGKGLITTLLVAFFGALAGLFIYTRFLDRSKLVIGTEKEKQLIEENARYTSMVPQSGVNDFTYAAEHTVHAVVHVKTKAMVSSAYSNPIYEFFYGPGASRPREVRGFGSGVIVTADGYIVTNNHVIEDADEVDVTLNDKRTFAADVVGRDPSTDIAVLKIKAAGLPYIRFGNSDAIRLGEWVLAVGNPFNLTSTVTAGIVSAKGRSLNLLDNQYRIESFIQTDAALNQGNSGGALVNVQGELIGITTAIISPSGAYAGNSFAVPTSIVKKIYEDLREYGEVQRGLMGINITDVTADIAEQEKLKEIRGVYLAGVVEDGAAKAAGLQEKDVIIAINGETVETTADLQEKVNRYRPGDKLEVTYLRKGKQDKKNVILRNIEGSTDVLAPGTQSLSVFGATFAPLTTGEKSKYKITGGVKITSITDGRFRDLGFGKGTVIVDVNGQRVNSAADVSRATENEKSLTSVEGFTPDGTYFKYQTRR
ncbi:MAG: Do family serine endopeptidase [Bacteroidales bacterium]|nr:Do family serine endopeptidase [Bacteroidales bacterium]HNT93930.1 Do family serine endopeptidase [Bacteroidales bacterium]HOO66276.1 Do family serine endopeptidase [Bacteroidales bacterium]HPE23246.1 Do family serine endopeptidase [Bacteroidales bacterium]HPJ04745.1 Do family serine endopeptidase [Bacteroidales bacterium]